MRINYLVYICLIFATTVLAQANPQAIPMDPNVIHGVLPNGMTYYIRSNQEPKERASFYIIQNVGALLEEDNQNGLAHFLEHMAFNGTKNFPEKGIINTLEKHGVAFGRNINAYTSFDETVYNISNVPVDHNGLVDTCLLILKDWSNNLLLTEEEIDLERGVITEEWRTRRTASFRMRNIYFPVLLKDSKYAERDVIGDLDIIKNFKPETLRDFYHQWYRTDLQAIAIVGDFDAKEIQKKVVALFSDIPPVENPPKRPSFEIPSHSEPRFCLATDKEASRNSISMYIKHEGIDLNQKDLRYTREKLIRSLFNAMTSARISELLQKGEPPFISGGISFGSFLRGYDAFSLSATANPNEEAKALKAIYTEAERVRRHGFTLGELERAKNNLLTSLEVQYKQRDKISHDRHARRMQNHFLTKDPLPSSELSYTNMKNMIPTISLNEVSQKAKLWMTTENRVLIITGVEDPNTKHLSEQEAFAILEAVESETIDPYEDEIKGQALIAEPLKGSSIVSEKQLEDFDAVEWTLANKARVIFRHADFEKDSVSLRAFSMGGSSLIEDPCMPETMMFESFVSAYGAGVFDNVSLKKLLAGKKASCSISLGEVTESFSGSSTPKDFETLLQLLYLKFEEPRFDREAHQALMARYESYVPTLQNNPKKIIQDHLTRILADDHPRARILDEQLLSEVDFNDIAKIYRDRFTDAQDFCFIIVGNLDVETVKPLVETYIGSLTSIDREETFVDRKVNPPAGKTIKQIEIPLTTPKATVYVHINYPMDYTPYNRHCLNTLKGILNIRYVETIREEEGGTYGVSTSIGLQQRPTSMANASFRFDCDPNKADHLKSLVYKELKTIAEEGPTQKDLDKAVSNILKNRQEAQQHNSYWLNTIYSYYYSGIDYHNPKNYENIFKKITPNDIKLITEALCSGDIVDITFMPKPK